jgi:acyl-CoA synthetase (AMP-forming)/AMP-acid ligase II
MNLAQILTDSARRDPGHVAVKLDDAELTYAQLDGASAHIAGLLSDHGFEPGDRVGIMLPNLPYFPVCYYGVLRAGGVVVPMNVLLKRREVAFYLKDSGAKLLFAWHEFSTDAQAGADETGTECLLVRPGEFERTVGDASPDTGMAATADNDTAVILYTSGTTGTPKGAELTHLNLTRNSEGSRNLFGLGHKAIQLGALPLFHSFGQTCGMNSTIGGYNVMKGYWQRPQDTAETIIDGWLHTGDMGKVDEDGYFYVVDRKKELIIRGGYNVYPREIEEVLYEHPDVREAAVVGLPHDEYGEEVGAAVSLKEGATTTPDELRAYVKEQVAAYKYPRRVWPVDDLPKGPTGKILKREIRPPDED